MNHLLLNQIALTGLLVGGAVWAGAGQAWALSVPEETIKTRVVAHVKQALETHFSRKLSAEELAVKVVKVPTIPREFPQSNTLGDITFELTSSLDKTYSNRGVVRVTMSDASGKTCQVGVPITLTLMRPVWIVDHPIPAGKTLSSKDLRVVKKEISQMAMSTVAADRDISTYEARINLQPGEILDIRKITCPPAIRRFSDIKVVLTHGEDFSIGAMGMALSDGHIGETIRVRIRPNNDVSRTKYYTAKVISKNQVQVEL